MFHQCALGARHLSHPPLWELCLAVWEQDARGRLRSGVLGREVQPAPCPVQKALPAPSRKPLLCSPTRGT